MGRRRKAWLTNGTGRRIDRGRQLPGYYVEWREGPKHRSKSFTTYKLAREYMVAMNRRLERWAVGGVLGIDWKSATEEFMGQVGLLAVNTQLHLSGTLSRFGLHVGVETLLGAVQTGHVESYLQNQRRDGLSEATCASHARYLRRFFRWCILRGYLRTDPVQGLTVRPVAMPRELTSLPTDADVQRLLGAIEGDRLRLATAIGLTTGLDRGVIAGLTPERINFNEGTVIVTRPKTRRVGGRPLTVPIHSTLLEPLRRIVAEGREGPLFREYAFRNWWRVARTKAGPPWTELRVADFRKIASGRFQRVAPLAQVRAMLGHASIQTTAAHYSPFDPSARQAFDELPLAWCEGTPPAT